MTAAQVEPVVVDGTGMLCVTLLLHLRRRIAHAPAGTVVHVVATDPAAPLDLPAWCRLTGHTYLGPVPDDFGRYVYALRTAADPPRHPPASRLKLTPPLLPRGARCDPRVAEEPWGARSSSPPWWTSMTSPSIGVRQVEDSSLA
ncbi:sulfurtransferase TusA family protein [Kitasatospora sp. NPDC085895]|uniref:sulfurtransferase TusA family protein n=1 Tax=Kitasatospora sp. NPDC085895 TaxID=3155057 RepID=UPI00344EDB74